MALRKGSAYSKRYARPYTRISKKQTKSYIKTVPNAKIVKYKMGDIRGFDKGEFPVELHIISKENCQIRDNSIEAVRQFFNRFIQTRLVNTNDTLLRISQFHSSQNLNGFTNESVHVTMPNAQVLICITARWLHNVPFPIGRYGRSLAQT